MAAWLLLLARAIARAVFALDTSPSALNPARAVAHPLGRIAKRPLRRRTIDV
jgi:hypothetical protein